MENRERTSGQIAPQPRFTHELHGIALSQRSFNLTRVNIRARVVQYTHTDDIQRN